MKKNSNSNGIHAQRLKAIRPFVSFDFDLRHKLTDYQKAKIREYYKEVEALTHRPYYVYKPRNKNHLKKAQQFAQHEKNLPGLKVAFVPVANEMKPKIRISKKGEFSVQTEYVKTNNLQLNKRQLLKNPIAHVNKVIATDPTAKRFTILAGKYEINRTYDRERIGEGVAFYVNKYSNAKANNYFGNWLHGLAAHHFKNQSDIAEYSKAKEKAKRKLKDKNKAARARAARAARKNK